MTTHRATFVVPPDHPAFPGHFPGNPVVPAVVLLEFVERALAQALGRPVRIGAIPTMKFQRPLPPATPFEVELTLADEGRAARFVCRAAHGELAQGRLEYADA